MVKFYNNHFIQQQNGYKYIITDIIFVHFVVLWLRAAVLYLAVIASLTIRVRTVHVQWSLHFKTTPSAR